MAKKPVEAPVLRNVMDMLTESSHKQFKDRVYTADARYNKQVGIEPYALAWQWLTHSNVIPLQAIVHIAAEPKSRKTTLLLEMIRWFINDTVSGKGVYIGTEGKINALLLRSLLMELMARLEMHDAASVEDPTVGWQAFATGWLKKVRGIMIKLAQARKDTSKLADYQHGFLSPVLLGVDSIGGVQSEDMREKVEANKHGKTFQERAMLNTQWLNTWSSGITGLPVTVVLVNHEKPGMNAFETTTPGGISPGFHCSLDIRCKRSGGDEVKAMDPYGATRVTTLQWKVYYSSIGRDGRTLYVPLCDGYDPNDNQVQWFDWDTALVDLMIRLQEDPEYDKLREAGYAIKEYNAGNKGLFYGCEAMKITSKEEAAAFAGEARTGSRKAVVGRFLQTTAEHRAALQKLMRIQMFQVWHPGFVFPEIPVAEEG